MHVWQGGGTEDKRVSLISSKKSKNKTFQNKGIGILYHRSESFQETTKNAFQNERS